MNDAPTADGGPGFLAFLAFFLLALALWFLMRNMNARMRRMSYRQQAAHRGKDEPQATPEDLVAEHDDPLPGSSGIDRGGSPGGPRTSPGEPDTGAGPGEGSAPSDKG